MSAQGVDREYLRRFRRVTIMGLGLFGGGVGAARYFSRLGAEVTVTDAASAEKLARSVAALRGLKINFRLGGHVEEDFTGADLVVANQAIRPDNPYLSAARGNGVPVLTETGIALALNRAPWIGITGSSGKSTTGALIAAMLERSDSETTFGGNIGGDLITRVENRPQTAPLVVELSSFQLAWMADALETGAVAPPRAAVVTNIAPNHLDWHNDLDEYAEAKRNLVRWQRPDGWALLNVSDARLREWVQTVPAKVIHCCPRDPGAENACFLDGDAALLRLEDCGETRFSLRDFRLLGRHNLENALEAIAGAFVMCRDSRAVAEGLDRFPGLPHRLETVSRAKGRFFVNDSKSTTPEAAITALSALPQPKVLIAGGYDKLSPFDELGAAIQENAAGLVLIGAAASRIRAAVLAAWERRPHALGELPIVEAGDDFDKAVRQAYRLAPDGGVVLLSPACASWGMFTNYEERGDAFKKIAISLE